MATPESMSFSSRASWMYTDPYAYQYSDIGFEDVIPAVSAGQQRIAAGSNLCELEGSTPTDMTTRYELAASPLSEAIRDSPQIRCELNGPCGVSRSRLSNGRASLRYSDRRRHTRDARAAPAPYSPESYSLHPASSGLISVAEDAPISFQPYTSSNTSPSRPNPQLSSSRYTDGLKPMDEHASTPKEPSSDFDAILRNIGPVSGKKDKGNTRRQRSIRYYDRYFSNFG
ncbi:hypothetical protein F5B18DRAFT_633530 [Nemania serpens]|nr:hypothetical protein F5B18DRAFT_633530 [Nemania serpens]